MEGISNNKAPVTDLEAHTSWNEASRLSLSHLKSASHQEVPPSEQLIELEDRDCTSRESARGNEAKTARTRSLNRNITVPPQRKEKSALLLTGLSQTPFIQPEICFDIAVTMTFDWPYIFREQDRPGKAGFEAEGAIWALMRQQWDAHRPKWHRFVPCWRVVDMQAVRVSDCRLV